MPVVSVRGSTRHQIYIEGKERNLLTEKNCIDYINMNCLKTSLLNISALRIIILLRTTRLAAILQQLLFIHDLMFESLKMTV